MSIFSACYKAAMRWSRLPNAPRYLAMLSFAESSFFPIPPDVMLAPMSLANPYKAMRFAAITTVASVLGGVFGYLIGLYLFEWVSPWLQTSRYMPAFQTAFAWFEQYGFWAVLVAGFSPIPYKVFTIAAGVLSMTFLPFVLASLIGRGARFFLVAGLMKWGGSAIEEKLHQSIDRIGWTMVAIIAIGFILRYFYG